MDFGVFAVGLSETSLLFSHFVHEVAFLLFQFLALIVNDFHLRIKDEFLSFNFERILSQVLNGAIEVSLHLGVFGLEQADMLM